MSIMAQVRQQTTAQRKRAYNRAFARYSTLCKLAEYRTLSTYEIEEARRAFRRIRNGC
jgi:hypothetical protein